MTRTPAASTFLSDARAGRAPGGVERPRLRASPPILRRPGSVQLGWDSPDAVVIEPGSGALADWLGLLDGSRGIPELIRAAHRLGLAAAQVSAVLRVLDDHGLLVRSEPPADSGRGRIRLVGAGRLGRAIAALLTGPEVAALELVDDEAVDGTLYPGAFGCGRQSAALAAELRTLPAACSRVPVISVHPASWATPITRRTGVAEPAMAVTVVASDRLEVDRMVTDALLRADQPHLIVRATGDGVAVGPLVLPGRTACVRCTDLVRSERDPDWPALLSQLVRMPGSVSPSMLGWAAATAASQVIGLLAALDERSPALLPDTAGHSLELGGDQRVRRRRWPHHPGCGCGWLTGPLPAG